MMNQITAETAYLEAPRNIVFKSDNIDVDLLRDGQVAVATEVTAISPGTETAAYAGLPPLRPGPVYPRVVGYCNVARVIGCGAGVMKTKVGDRVLSFTSHRSHAVLSEKDVLAVIDPDIATEDAACTYLYHLGYNAVLKSDIRLGSAVVVIGLGVLGLTTLSMAELAGARTVAVSDSKALRFAAAGMGAEQTAGRETAESLVRHTFGDGLAHVVIVTTNSWADWQLALRLTGKQGCILVLGFPGRDGAAPETNPLNSQYFYDRQIRIVAAGISPAYPDDQGFTPFNQQENLFRILNWIRRDKIRPKSIVSGSMPAHQVESVYQRLLSKDGKSITYLLDWRKND